VLGALHASSSLLARSLALAALVSPDEARAEQVLVQTVRRAERFGRESLYLMACPVRLDGGGSAVEGRADQPTRRTTV
jgi:hypothetical protein